MISFPSLKGLMRAGEDGRLSEKLSGMQSEMLAGYVFCMQHNANIIEITFLFCQNDKNITLILKTREKFAFFN